MELDDPQRRRSIDPRSPPAVDPLNPYDLASDDHAQLEYHRSRQLAYQSALGQYRGALLGWIRAVVAFVQSPSDQTRDDLYMTTGAMIVAREAVDTAQFDRVVNGVSLQQLAGLIGGDLQRDLERLREQVEKLEIT